MTTIKNATAHQNEQQCFVLKQEVTKRVDGQTKREPIGHFEVIVPSVERFITELADVQVTGHDDDGLPTFNSNAANWLQRAINALSKAEARNKLAPASAEPKAGLTIPMTFADLVAPPAIGGSTALAELAELVKGFTAWMAESGKPAALHSTFGQLVRQPSLISVQSDKVKQVLQAWVVEFASAAAAAGALSSYQESQVQKVLDAIEGKDEPSLDDLLADY